jgi:hypothetical protein
LNGRMRTRASLPDPARSGEHQSGRSGAAARVPLANSCSPEVGAILEGNGAVTAVARTRPLAKQDSRRKRLWRQLGSELNRHHVPRECATHKGGRDEGNDDASRNGCVVNRCRCNRRNRPIRPSRVKQQPRSRRSCERRRQRLSTRASQWNRGTVPKKAEIEARWRSGSTGDTRRIARAVNEALEPDKGAQSETGVLGFEPSEATRTTQVPRWGQWTRPCSRRRRYEREHSDGDEHKPASHLNPPEASTARSPNRDMTPACEDAYSPQPSKPSAICQQSPRPSSGNPLGVDATGSA